VPITRRCCGSGGYSKELISLDVQGQIATTAAVGAEGLHLLIMKWTGFALTDSFLQSPGGAQIQAQAARDAVGVEIGSILKVNGIRTLEVGTRFVTLSTANAFVGIQSDELVGVAM
jgi:hypothetical protein